MKLSKEWIAKLIELEESEESFKECESECSASKDFTCGECYYCEDVEDCKGWCAFHGESTKDFSKACECFVERRHAE